MDSKASAVWKGDLKSGSGAVSSASGALSDTAYTFATRFEGRAGSNPEEMIAAAHAGCFSMAFSAELGKAGLTPDHVTTSATVTLDMLDGGPTVTKIHLETTARVPGASQEAFDTAANNAKTGCPISRLLNAAISLNAVLEA